MSLSTVTTPMRNWCSASMARWMAAFKGLLRKLNHFTIVCRHKAGRPKQVGLAQTALCHLLVGTFYDDGLSWSACNVYYDDAYNKMNRRSSPNCDDACIFVHDLDFASRPSMSVWCLCGGWMNGRAIFFSPLPQRSVLRTLYMLRGSLLNDQMPFGLPMWFLVCPHLFCRSFG